jgi:acetoin:2,6-dichlorophenolindophenol oxidoreductase subunit alpha
MTATSGRLPDHVLPSGTGSVDAESILTGELALQLYRRMILIRRFEDVVQRLYNEGHVRGTTHVYSGQEAIAVGICSMVRGTDYIAATYRGHGHALALGTEPQSLMDELLGRSTGVCGGRAGSMNIVDPAHGLIGCFGIVGGSIAAATGAALAVKGSGAIAIAFFGDGAANQGYFLECLNFAQVLRLPLLLICENNQYGEFTPWEQVTAGTICARVSALGIPTSRINGNDLWAVRETATRVMDEVRSNGYPVFVEAITYRFGGHSRSDPGRYRPAGELEAWRAHDPLLLTRQRLLSTYQVKESELDRAQQSVDDEVAEMVRKGLAAPMPSLGQSFSEFMP